MKFLIIFRNISFCKELIRRHEIIDKVEKKDDKETLEDYESQGGHVQINDTYYITPLCRKHNKESVGKKIVLKAGAILVEEVDPVIEGE